MQSFVMSVNGAYIKKQMQSMELVHDKKGQKCHNLAKLYDNEVRRSK